MNMQGAYSDSSQYWRTQRDEIMPEGTWAFDGKVTDAFDDMLRRSIPDYEQMRRSCLELGSRFVQSGTDIVDLGCSRGDALAPFVERFGERNTYRAIEISEPMLEVCRIRFADRPYVKVWKMDLRKQYPVGLRASLTLAVLTLQFTPIEYRQRIVRDIYKATVGGGALILVEKVLGASADLDALFVESYYDLKRAAGYSEEQIMRKRLALEGVLVPVTARWNEELLYQAGFTEVDCFWRLLNFCGWVALKN